MNDKLKQIIKEEIKKALREQDNPNPEQVVDQGATQVNMAKFAGLPYSAAAIETIRKDLEKAGPNKYKALAWLLTQLGVQNNDVGNIKPFMSNQPAQTQTPTK